MLLLLAGLGSSFLVPDPDVEWPLWCMTIGSLMWLVFTPDTPNTFIEHRANMRPLTPPAMLVLLVLGVWAAAIAWGAPAAWAMGVVSAPLWCDILLTWHRNRMEPEFSPWDWARRNSNN